MYQQNFFVQDKNAQLITTDDKTTDTGTVSRLAICVKAVNK